MDYFAVKGNGFLLVYFAWKFGAGFQSLGKNKINKPETQAIEITIQYL